jgi:hypothetical protein
MRLQRAMVLGCAVTLLLAACGDDDDDGDDESTSSTTEQTLPGDEGGAADEVVALTVAPLTGAAEVPGPGQDGATGTVDRLDVTATQVCVTLSVDGLDSPATAAHIHPGGPTESGPPVVNFGDPADAAAGSWDTCVDADEAIRSAIVANPTGYYVNVHTETFPNGAVRGQLTG